MNVTLFAHHNALMDRFEVLCQSICMYFNLHSGPQWMKLILSRTSCLQARSLWDWWLCWWHVCPVALREFTLKKSLRRLNRACGSVIYSWVSEASVCVVGWDDLRCVNIRVWNSCSVWQKTWTDINVGAKYVVGINSQVTPGLSWSHTFCFNVR